MPEPIVSTAATMRSVFRASHEIVAAPDDEERHAHGQHLPHGARLARATSASG